MQIQNRGLLPYFGQVLKAGLDLYNPCDHEYLLSDFESLILGYKSMNPSYFIQ